MEHKQIASIAELPAHLHRAYKAARAVGMDCTVYTVRDEVVLYANGRIFNPDDRSMDAFELVRIATPLGHYVQMTSGPDGISVVLVVSDTLRKCSAYRETPSRMEPALRACITTVFASLYDHQTAPA